MALAPIAVLCCSNTVIGLIRHFIPYHIRIVVQLAMKRENILLDDFGG